jgi:hypothetical protein
MSEVAVLEERPVPNRRKGDACSGERKIFVRQRRGLPALLYRMLVGTSRSMAAGLLQATSLSFIVAATQIDRELGLITKARGAALIAAGLQSVLIFPILALSLLRRRETDSSPAQKRSE